MFSEKVLRGIYKKDSPWLMANLGLRFLARQDGLKMAGLHSDLFFAVNHGFSTTAHMAVAGGGCFGYCGGHVGQLTYDYLADTILPIYVGAFLELPVLLYLQAEEEIAIDRLANGQNNWSHATDTIERFAVRTAEYIGVRQLHLLRTDRPHINSIVSEAAVEVGHLLTNGELANLYQVYNAKQRRENDVVRLAQHRRCVTAYLPSVASRALGVNFSSILVVENIHQSRSINAARKLLPILSEGDVLNHLVYAPAPSVTGSRRMCIARRESQLRMCDSPASIKQACSEMPLFVRAYWEAVMKLLGTCDLVEGMLQARNLFFAADRC